MTTIGGPERTYPTKDTRIRIARYGEQHWRTEVIDEPGSDDWSITGPPYTSRAAATGMVDEILYVYFGEGLSRAELAEGSRQKSGQLNPSLLIQRGHVLEMSLAPGNVLRIDMDGEHLDVRVLALAVDEQGVPLLSLEDASAAEMTARAEEARHAGGPVAP